MDLCQSHENDTLSINSIHLHVSTAKHERTPGRDLYCMLTCIYVHENDTLSINSLAVRQQPNMHTRKRPILNVNMNPQKTTTEC